MDFFTLKAKKAFTKALILYHFEPKRYIQIEIDSSHFAISQVPSKLISDQFFSGHMIHKNLNSSIKSKIDIWYLIAFF